jgi:microcystin-dependent protein
MPANTVKARLDVSGPPEDYTLDNFAEVIKNIISKQSNDFVLGVPIGTIIDFAGQIPPANYIPCDGRVLSIEEYLELYNAIGDVWGSPSPLTFNIPNLNKRTTIGKGDQSTGQSSESIGSTLGSLGGIEKYKLTIKQIPKHKHGFSFTVPAHSHTITLDVNEFAGVYETGSVIKRAYDNYITVIGGVPGSAPKTSPSGPLDILTNTRAKASGKILQHKNFIQTNVVEYVQENFLIALSGINTEESNKLSTKCFRDAGYIVDSLAADILNNANHRSVETGSLYFSGFLASSLSNRLVYPGSTVPSLPENQVIPTIEAIKAIGTFITGIDFPINSIVTKVGILSSDEYFGMTQKHIYKGFNIYSEVINNIENIPMTTPNGVVFDNTYFIAATSILDKKAEIQLSVVNYVKDNFPASLLGTTVEESNSLSARCFRDTGFILDSLAADLKNNANHRCIETGVFYFSGAVLLRDVNNNTGVPTLPANQVDATISAISSIKMFIDQYSFPISDNTNNQIKSLLETVYYPLQNNGKTLAYFPNGVSTTETKTAASKLRDVKRSIQEKVRNYVVVKSYLPDGSENLLKCTRDVGYMIDSIISYLETGVDAKVVQYAVAYWDGSTSRLLDSIPNQRNNTIDTIRYLSSLLLNEFISDKGSVANEIKQLIDTMIFPLQTGGQSVPYQPAGSPLTPDRQIASEILRSNRSLLQNQMRTFVNNLGILNLRDTAKAAELKDKCSRDVGYMIDSVISDLTTGVIAKSVQFALAYWDGSKNRIGGDRVLSNGNPDQIKDTVRTVEDLKRRSLALVISNGGAITSTSPVTYTTSTSGRFDYDGLTDDGSFESMGQDFVSNLQPTAVVNKCIKAR